MNVFGIDRALIKKGNQKIALGRNHAEGKMKTVSLA